jgi:myo-inositol catabolism protein IolS
MRMVRLGRTEASVSAVSYGTWPFSGPSMAGDRSVGWTGHDDGLALDALREAHDQGVRHWDTADVYGNGRSEELIARVWADLPRDSVYLASKTGWNPGAYEHFYHPEQVRGQLEGSLKRLGTDHIDLYYLHHCDFGPSDQYLDDALAVLHEARDRGLIRHIGLSDWDCARVADRVERVDPDVVQVYRNVRDDAYVTSGLAQRVNDGDLGAVFFSPLRHGLLTGKYASPTTFPEGDFRRNVEDFGNAVVLEGIRRATFALRERFSDHAEPVLHALLGAILDDAPTGCAIVGLRNPEQVNAASQAGEALDPETRAWVRGLYADLSAP